MQLLLLFCMTELQVHMQHGISIAQMSRCGGPRTWK